MNETSKPKIGFALGSGASRGWSHIGVLEALVREGIEPDIICGTSVGAMVGGSYAAGNLESLKSWVLSSKRSDVLKFFDMKPTKATEAKATSQRESNAQGDRGDAGKRG